MQKPSEKPQVDKRNINPSVVVYPDVGSADVPKGISEDTKEKELTWVDIGEIYKEYKRSIGYRTPEEKPEKERKESKVAKRAWFLTINNPTAKDFLALHKDNYQYCQGQIEMGDNGTLHIQCVIYYNNKRVCPVKKYPRAYIAACENFGASCNYCEKGETRVLGPWDFGERPHKGRRTDLIAIKDRIMKGTTVDELTLENPELYHEFGRTLTKLEDMRMCRMFRTEMTQCVWLTGKTATGKSHRAFANFNPDTHYKFPYDGEWWDNYRQQPIVIFNEFRGDAHIPFCKMLEIIDKFPCDVRRRNRPPMPFMSKLVIITSPLLPEQVYGRVDKDDNFEQFRSRINVITLSKQYLEKRDVSINNVESLYKSITGKDPEDYFHPSL